MGHGKLPIVDTAADILTPAHKACGVSLLLLLALLAPHALLLDAELRQWLVLLDGRVVRVFLDLHLSLSKVHRAASFTV